MFEDEIMSGLSTSMKARVLQMPGAVAFSEVSEFRWDKMDEHGEVVVMAIEKNGNRNLIPTVVSQVPGAFFDRICFFVV